MQRYYMPYENTCTYAVCIAGSIGISKNVTIQGEILHKLHSTLGPTQRTEMKLVNFCRLTLLVDPMGTHSVDEQ